MAKIGSIQKTATRAGPVVDRKSPIPADELGAWLADTEPSSELEPVPSPARLNTPPGPEVTLEPVLRRLLYGDHKAKFLLLADWFESAIGRRPADVCVEADVGDVFFEVIDWIDTPGFLKLVVDRSRMPFEPKAMTQMRLRRRDQVYHTTCVSPMSPMFGSLPFSEVILVVDSVTDLTQVNMEKNARITPGVTPSVVSGRPSTGIDNDEPVAEGEKAASAKGALPDRDFDVSRELGED